MKVQNDDVDDEIVLKVQPQGSEDIEDSDTEEENEEEVEGSEEEES